MKPKAIILIRILSAIFLLLVMLLVTAVLILKNYTDPWNKKIIQSGYSEKKIKINKVMFSYVEGPENGPPLVLLHAQHMDWFSHSRVLPELSKCFHVYDIDYPGHGATSCPETYPMNANQIGSDLGDFISQVIGKSVYITGNSSGGLLAAWLAANRHELVKAVLLEDPPLFSAEYPGIKKQSHTVHLQQAIILSRKIRLTFFCTG